MIFTWWQNKQKLEYGHSCIIDAVNFPSSFAYHPSTHDSLWGQHPTPSPKPLAIQGGRQMRKQTRLWPGKEGAQEGPGLSLRFYEEVKTRLSINSVFRGRRGTGCGHPRKRAQCERRPGGVKQLGFWETTGVCKGCE